MSMEKINSEELNGKQERIPLSDDEMEQVAGGRKAHADMSADDVR